MPWGSCTVAGALVLPPGPHPGWGLQPGEDVSSQTRPPLLSTTWWKVMNSEQESFEAASSQSPGKGLGPPLHTAHIGGNKQQEHPPRVVTLQSLGSLGLALRNRNTQAPQGHWFRHQAQPGSRVTQGLGVQEDPGPRSFGIKRD